MAEGQADKLAAGKGCKNGTLALTESDKGKSFEIERLSGGIVVSRVFKVNAKPAYLGLTSAQQAFLKSMAPDWPEPSVVTEIARRSGKSTAWAAAYRKSLIDANVIEASGRGLVSYAIPHFGEYMERVTSAVERHG